MNAPRARAQRRPVHGVLLLDKPRGLSSSQALQKARWLLRAEKAGHTGTLDPLATGVLPLCFGAAAKFSQQHLDADKAYEAVARLGVKTSTGDAEGEVVAERPVPLSTAQLTARLAELARRFTGRIHQVPPMHSALKKDGKALYVYARAGLVLERALREVEIFALDLAEVQDSPPHRAIKIIVRCGKGTYIRTLGEDLGEALGCGAHLLWLRRTAAGGFDLGQCVSLEALAAMEEERRLACLRPVEALLAGCYRVTLDASHAARFLSGLRRRGDWPDVEQAAVFGPEGALLGTARIARGELIPGRLLSPPEIRQILENRS